MTKADNVFYRLTINIKAPIALKCWGFVFPKLFHGYFVLVELKTQVKRIKKKTFELFRRDSRNIEIITYDELYERAKFIAER